MSISHLIRGLLKVRLASLRVGLHALLAGLPVGGAYLAMDIGELEGLYQSKCLVDRSANGQIVDGDLAQILLAVDNEEATEWNARLLVEHAVVASDLHRLVGQQRDGQVAEAALFAWLVDPGKMREVAVSGAADHHGIDGIELSRTVRIGDDLSGADKGAKGR